VISLVGVGKRYGRGPLVLSGIDLVVRPGEPLVVRGANGSGKSTLLRIVAGCAAPTHGRVVGLPATVGYVPDRFPARLRMPADVYLGHLLRVRPHRTAGEEPRDLLQRLGFRGGTRTSMNQLSKGNAQKVGLAQALSSGALLLVLDEPWSGLDADTRPILTAAIAKAVADGVALVVADHTGTADTLVGHRAVAMRDGRLVDAELDSGRTVAVTLRCDAPDRVVPRLAQFGGVERRDGGLVLRVSAADVDALLLTALRIGCSVWEVRECAH
jgi:ABC-2 type transport system ATP-binding protein